jgi:hypothetical protein
MHTHIDFQYAKMVTGLVFTLLIAVSSGQRQIWRYPVTKKPRPGCDTDAGQIIPGEEPDSVSFSFLLHRTLRDKSSVIIYGPYLGTLFEQAEEGSLTRS